MQGGDRPLASAYRRACDFRDSVKKIERKYAGACSRQKRQQSLMISGFMSAQ